MFCHLLQSSDLRCVSQERRRGCTLRLLERGLPERGIVLRSGSGVQYRARKRTMRLSRSDRAGFKGHRPSAALWPAPDNAGCAWRDMRTGKTTQHRLMCRERLAARKKQFALEATAAAASRTDTNGIAKLVTAVYHRASERNRPSLFTNATSTCPKAPSKSSLWYPVMS